MTAAVRQGNSTLRLARTTGTHADVFAVVGLADLLASQAGDTHVRLVEEAQAFRVEVDAPLDEASLPVGPGYPYLQPTSRDAVPAGVVDRVDYEAEREKARRYREAHQALREAARKKLPPDPALEQAIQDEQPRDDWPLLRVMYALTNHVAPNRVHASLVARRPAEVRQEIVGALRALAAGETPRVGWKADAVQLFNPMAAKGYARLKPDSTDRNDKTKEQWTDPFVEWLRYRGYFRVACPFFQGSKGEHIRVYTPIPADVSLALLRRAVTELRGAPLWGGAPKLDALVVLGLAEFLIRRSHEGQASGSPAAGEADLFELGGRTPAEVVSGLTITHYQSLGSARARARARAVSSLATLAVPGWFPIQTPEDATAWLQILDEHRRVVRGLDESHSDEIGLLVGYRRFLERRGRAALAALLDFGGAYGDFLLRAWDAGRRVRAFRTTNLRRLIEGMAPEYAAIVADSGFAAIARAVRRATVQAQFLKAKGAKDVREIRYDLLPELRRARALPSPALFVEAVADFVAKYNAENARRREIGKLAPANVRTDELAGFLQLVDQHGAGVVGALLCAYGTCVEPREGEGPEPAGDAGDQSAEAASLIDQTTDEEE